MNSELIQGIFKDELDRTERLISRYETELQGFPKGSVYKRKIGHQEYYYLNYREGKKVVSKFLGNVSNFNINEIEQKINKRNEITLLLKKLKNDKESLEKELSK